MGGVDVIRGIGFQQAWAINEALRLLEDSSSHALRVESEEDIVDVEVLQADESLSRAVQVRTRQEPYSWSAGDIRALFKRWDLVADAHDCMLMFVTDGSLSTSGAALNDLVISARSGASDIELAARAGDLGLKDVPSASFLARVEILTRAGTLGALMERLELRVLRLIENIKVVTSDDATRIVDALFRLMFERGGTAEAARRLVTRDEILSILGVTQLELDSTARAWDQESRNDYLQRLLARPLQDDVIWLRVEQQALPLSVTRLERGGEESRIVSPQPLETVLDNDDVLLIGAAGAGKTTSLDLLERRAAEQGRLPVTIRAEGHSLGAVLGRIRRRVEGILEVQLSAVGAERLLADEGLLILMDGVSEVDDGTQAALRQDLMELRARRAFRLIATGRNLSSVRVVAGDIATAFLLRGLEAEDRLTMARPSLGPAAEDAVARIEGALGPAVENPLLLRMALAVLSEGGEITSRATVYGHFVGGLVRRSGAPISEISLPAMGVTWAGLLGESRRATDGYEWRARLAESLEYLDRIPAFKGHGISATRVWSDATTIGLLFRPDPDAGLVALHDSIADYLAGWALANRWSDLLHPLAPAQEEAILFASELSPLPPALERLIAEENPFLACRISASPWTAPGELSPTSIRELLDLLIGDANLPLLRPKGLAIVESSSSLGVILSEATTASIDVDAYWDAAESNLSWELRSARTCLSIAAQLWATGLDDALHKSPDIRSRTPSSAEEIARRIAEHQGQVTLAIEDLIDRFFRPALGERVRTAIGSPGFIAVVHPLQAGPEATTYFPVSYARKGEEVLVGVEGDDRIQIEELTGKTVAEALLRKSPGDEAASEIVRALNELTKETWPLS